VRKRGLPLLWLVVWLKGLDPVSSDLYGIGTHGEPYIMCLCRPKRINDIYGNFFGSVPAFALVT